MKTSKNREIKPSRISAPSPKPQKYLYAKIMAYTVFALEGWELYWKEEFSTHVNDMVTQQLQLSPLHSMLTEELASS